MNKRLIGMVTATVLLAVCFYIYVYPKSKHQSDTPSTALNTHLIDRCSATNRQCIRYKSAYRGISGSARLSGDALLVVHDLHTGLKQIHLNRLGVIQRSGNKQYIYHPISIDKPAWHQSGKVSDDLESACRLSDDQVLVAESGRTDKRIGGEVTEQDWLGRIFHLQIDLSGQVPTATVLDIPKLRLPPVSAPVFSTADPKTNEFPHSSENYEAMACVQINQGLDEPARFLVVVAERGGTQTHTSSLHWGIYDSGQPLASRQINWSSSLDAQGVVAPGKAQHTDPEWRDITGLHIDDKGRLYATAAHDSGVDEPPYSGVLYQLGVVCIDTKDQHGKADLCDYSKPPRPAVFGSFSVLLQTNYHKLESVSGSLSDSGKLSIAAEDEDSGGVWWPNAFN